MRWAVVAIVGLASAGLLAVSVSMNFSFGSSFGRTALESYAYGAAFGFADILKVAAPIVVANSFGNRRWGAALLALFLWGTFTACPQAHTLASLTGAGVDKVEIGLILLVALLVEMGGLGPFVTMSLAKVPRPTKVSVEIPRTREPAPEPDHTALAETHPFEQPTGTSSSTTPRLIYSSVGPENLASDLERFLNLHARRVEGSTLGSTDL